jgi:hypothetical protein
MTQRRIAVVSRLPVVHPGIGHDAWNLSGADPALLSWLIAQAQAQAQAKNRLACPSLR